MAIPTKIEWQAYNREAQAHGPDWYWAVGIIALSIVVTAVILDNVLFAVLILISTVVLFLRTLQAPRRESYTLTVKGIWSGKEFIPYQALESFCLPDESTAAPALLVKERSITAPLRIIPLGEEGPDAVREFLAKYLPEAELREPLSKKIMEFLGF